MTPQVTSSHKTAKDKNVRNIRKDTVEQFYKAIAGIQLRIMDKDASMKQLDIFKLEMCKKNLNCGKDMRPHSFSIDYLTQDVTKIVLFKTILVFIG